MKDTRRQTIVGTVVSNKMEKTAVVQVETLRQHPQYKKFTRTRKNFKAHDEKNECELGDVVRCMETRPLSKDKRWRVTEIVTRHYTSVAEVADPEEMVIRKHKRRQERAAAAAAEQAGEQSAAQPTEQPAEQAEQTAEQPAEPPAEKAEEEKKESE
jgi:small subunit ribosomal protein S17